MSDWNVADRVAVITGGNSGIGRATAVALAQRGAHVVFTSRDVAKGERSRAEMSERAGRELTLLQLDLASFHSIRRFASEVCERYPQLHVLVNNAGLVLGERRETEQGFEMMFGVNHLGHFLLTALLVDRLRSSAPGRIVNVSSDAHRRAPGGIDFDDLQSRLRFNTWFAYCRSKLANVYFTRELARRLEGSGVTVNAVHPGVVATGFARDGDVGGPIGLFFRVARPLLLTEEQGAATTIYAVTAPELATKSGAYFSKCRETPPSRAARDDRAARRLWDISEQLVTRGHP